MKTVILALLAVALAPQAGYRAEIDKYRADRITELTAPDGWLAVRGLFWLHAGPNIAGSDPASAIALPSRAPKRLGTFTLDKGTVTFTAEPGAAVTAGGKSVSEYTFTRAESSAIQFSGMTITAIRRGDKVGLRMWDPDSPHRTTFKGLTYFPLNTAYRFQGKFVPYDTPKQVPVPNVLGQLVQMESPGYVQFAINGTTYTLEPVYETSKHEDLFFIFRDLTSRTETYEAGRFLHTPLPKDGIVDLDFNRAYNPPCAFTEFATCPLPVKDNQLPIRIPAGELRYHVTDR